MTDDERRAIHTFRQIIDIVDDVADTYGTDDLQIATWLGTLETLARHAINVIEEADRYPDPPKLQRVRPRLN